MGRVVGRAPGDVYALEGAFVSFGPGGRIVHYGGSSWAPTRVDLRDPALGGCPDFKTLGRMRSGEIFAIDSVGRIFAKR